MRTIAEFETCATSFTEVGFESLATVASRCTLNGDVPPPDLGMKKTVVPSDDE